MFNEIKSLQRKTGEANWFVVFVLGVQNNVFTRLVLQRYESEKSFVIERVCGLIRLENKPISAKFLNSVARVYVVHCSLQSITG